MWPGSVLPATTMNSDNETQNSDATDDQGHFMDEGSLVVRNVEEDTDGISNADDDILDQEDFSMDEGNLVVHKIEEDTELPLPESPDNQPTLLQSPRTESKIALPIPTPPAPAVESKPAIGSKPNYKHQFTLSGHNMSISSLKFSPSGSMLASSGVFACPVGVTQPLMNRSRRRGQGRKIMGRVHRRDIAHA